MESIPNERLWFPPEAVRDFFFIFSSSCSWVHEYSGRNWGPVYREFGAISSHFLSLAKVRIQLSTFHLVPGILPLSFDLCLLNSFIFIFPNPLHVLSDMGRSWRVIQTFSCNLMYFVSPWYILKDRPWVNYQMTNTSCRMAVCALHRLSRKARYRGHRWYQCHSIFHIEIWSPVLLCRLRWDVFPRVVERELLAVKSTVW